MKTNITRKATKVTLFAAVLMATCLFAGSANAQSAFQGKFTLPHETRWGQAALPAGDYQLEFTNNNGSTMLIIRDANSLRVVAYESPSIREDSAKGESALLIGNRGSQRVVHSLRIAELGETFISDPELAHGRGPREEARSTEAVPVLEATK